jgi:hypothetical protein
MKKFLLIAGDGYYPSERTGDWVGCFETEEKAMEKVKIVDHVARTGIIYSSIYVDGEHKDWFCVVNLDDWMNK